MGPSCLEPGPGVFKAEKCSFLDARARQGNRGGKALDWLVCISKVMFLSEHFIISETVKGLVV